MPAAKMHKGPQPKRSELFRVKIHVSSSTVRSHPFGWHGCTHCWLHTALLWAIFPGKIEGLVLQHLGVALIEHPAPISITVHHHFWRHTKHCCKHSPLLCSSSLPATPFPSQREAVLERTPTILNHTLQPTKLKEEEGKIRKY